MTRAFIRIKLFATLNKFMPKDGADTVSFFPGMTVRSLLSQLHIPESEAKLIFINGKKASLGTELHPGDRVGIFPPVGGG
ncbi:MAG: MoaD/ThiS family protein [Deltaproteobacteria bacterium]|nr:MoaD/ThiS family protein [Deltaproteobacteria bacterium]MBW1961434.1 MoaD/ThiS family protein [Deltaproteobacteria bacterium]MBW1992863.1 MoaD/ThiS family protein [Deltaproteobacteria bacterium]MBW2153241.1 MoaD/ThiS family protein [Deltaproteobacteria bacterium]